MRKIENVFVNQKMKGVGRVRKSATMFLSSVFAFVILITISGCSFSSNLLKSESNPNVFTASAVNHQSGNITSKMSIEKDFEEINVAASVENGLMTVILMNDNGAEYVRYEFSPDSKITSYKTKIPKGNMTIFAKSREADGEITVAKTDVV